MLSGWTPFYRTSLALGARGLTRRRARREALKRILVPMEDSRFVELPATLAALGAESGAHVLDLASPKLAAVHLAQQGVRVTSVDLLASEIATWRELGSHVEGLDFLVADGTSLPFADDSFDHAYSVSVLEHMGGDGDVAALDELARVVRPGGRIVVTVPYGREYSEDWRDAPTYGEQGQQADSWFFQRIYDDERIDRLVARTPTARVVGRQGLSVTPSRLYRLYQRAAPASLLFGPLLAMTQSVAEGPSGLMLLTFEVDGPTRRADGA